jgi:hypothetical protein
MAPTLGGEPNKKFKQCRSGTMDIGISVLPGPIMIINVGSSVTCVSAVCGDFCVPRRVVFPPFLELSCLVRPSLLIRSDAL